MESPLKVLRKKLNCTQSELAILSDEKQGHISGVEKGYLPLDNKILEFVESIGINPAEIRQEQNRYMQHVKNQLHKRALKQEEVE